MSEMVAFQRAVEPGPLAYLIDIAVVTESDPYQPQASEANHRRSTSDKTVCEIRPANSAFDGILIRIELYSGRFAFVMGSRGGFGCVVARYDLGLAARRIILIIDVFL